MMFQFALDPILVHNQFEIGVPFIDESNIFGNVWDRMMACKLKIVFHHEMKKYLQFS